jgi:hypothetical protein
VAKRALVVAAVVAACVAGAVVVPGARANVVSSTKHVCVLKGTTSFLSALDYGERRITASGTCVVGLPASRARVTLTAFDSCGAPRDPCVGPLQLGVTLRTRDLTTGATRTTQQLWRRVVDDGEREHYNVLAGPARGQRGAAELRITGSGTPQPDCFSGGGACTVVYGADIQLVFVIP